MPQLLEMLALKGRIVTADAMHTQRATAEAVTARGGDYVLALKANQDSLHEDVRLYLDDPARADELPSCQQVDGDHGRIETRRATVCHEVAWLQERHGWPGLAAFGKIEATRETPRQTKTETRYYIMSAPLSPDRFQHVVRAHWAIENCLHWVLEADQEAVKIDVHAVMNAPNRRRAESAARHFADRWEGTYPKAVASLRNDLDDLLTCFRYKDLAERKQVRTTNAIERRFREVRRRTRPMGTFQDRTSMDRILFAVFIHENKSQGISTPVSVTHKS